MYLLVVCLVLLLLITYIHTDGWDREILEKGSKDCCTFLKLPPFVAEAIGSRGPALKTMPNPLTSAHEIREHTPSNILMHSCIPGPGLGSQELLWAGEPGAVSANPFGRQGPRLSRVWVKA